MTDSFPRRAKFQVGKMLNSAVAVINNSTLRRRSHFARSTTTNSFGPIPIDGDGSSPLMYSSQRSESATSSTNSIPGLGTGSNLIKVRSLEQSMETDLNQITLSEINEKGEIIPYNNSGTEKPKEKSSLDDFIKIAEYMYITDNRKLLGPAQLESAGITHLISVGKECIFQKNSRTGEAPVEVSPMTLTREIDVDPAQPFTSLVPQLDMVNQFIENARKCFQKVTIYSPNREESFFVAAQYNVDYYDLEPAKAMNHLQKLTGEDWVELPNDLVERLKEWKNLGAQRRAQSPTQRKLCLSINSVSK